MKRKGIERVLAITLAASILCACAGAEPEGAMPDEMGQGSGQEGETGESVQEESALLADIEPINRDFSGSRPLFSKGGAGQTADIAAPSVEAYAAEPDLSNVDNLWQFYLQDEFKARLAENGFVVWGEAGFEFYEIYENNRYEQIASFVTVDSLMHTYHLYFAHLMKNVEKEYLYAYLTLLSRKMLESSAVQYELLKGSEWESAAMRCVAYFAVGASLLGDRVEIPDYAAETVRHELEAIGRAEGIKESELTGDYEDYSQYKPRGYYEGDARLERYFQAMMWYGRIHFAQENEELDRSALLISEAAAADEEIYGLWEAVYAVTSFFAGTSDDAGVCEYIPLMKEVYGEDMTPGSLIGTPEKFDRFHEMTAELAPPQINSILLDDGESNVNTGFRFMGQRFTVDAAVMQKLIYSSVGENSAGEWRMLPEVLDMPAALGSDTALRILEENGAADYEGYSENMERLRTVLAADRETLWSASLYAGWLNTLRPLLEIKGEGYPVFMQGEEWAKKNLECFAGSFTELKHDTVLYSKQAMAEMGGGWEQEPDDRGYVEPEPLVYARFENLAAATAEGLKEYGMLRADDEENLERLAELARRLYVISNKELREEALTEEEYELIRCYGGSIEHFWYETFEEQIGEEGFCSRDCPAAVVVDIATDPDGQVLEAATGNPSDIYVLVKVDGRIKIARGSVYSFYQFAWPADDRLTDSDWRQMIGAQIGDDGYYDTDTSIRQPEWTESYRYQWKYE
ncbi:MAG: DUF3160 domain-containing protein [Blautia sp.]|nr:DUF3160 domain-containing protein [Blautia sp.]MCM1199654.1 DUF3160 domain-containing protein [Bacteroides fragilis]